MDSLPDIEPAATPSHTAQPASQASLPLYEGPVSRRVGQWWRWGAVAASLLLLFGVGAVIFFNRQKQDGGVLAKQSNDVEQTQSIEQTRSVEQSVEPVSPVQHIAPVQPKQSVQPRQHITDAQSVSPVRNIAQAKPTAPVQPVQSAQPVEDAALTQTSFPPIPAHYTPAPQTMYASRVIMTDSVYQPSRMDEFIAKMADFQQVQALPLDCTCLKDTTVVNTAYLFPDKKEVNVFGRLLQAACSYDDSSPGYLLNYSHQQFFFTLEDTQKRQRYLWIAERINGERILLFCTHAPLDAAPSSACYYLVKEELTKTMGS